MYIQNINEPHLTTCTWKKMSVFSSSIGQIKLGVLRVPPYDLRFKIEKTLCLCLGDSLDPSETAGQKIKVLIFE